MKLGESLQLGPYTVRAMLRHDNPAFLKYVIFRGDELLGRQFSMPNESDCRWHEIRKGEYAKAEESRRDSAWQLKIQPKRGRPSKAVLALRAIEARMAQQVAEDEMSFA